MDMTLQSTAPLAHPSLNAADRQPRKVARFRTLAGQMLSDSLKFTRVVHTGNAQYEIQCSACGQTHDTEPFKFQSDTTDAARTHANRCLA